MAAWREPPVSAKICPMTRSELIERLRPRVPSLGAPDTEIATKVILAALDETLSRGNRIEIRGFGAFSLSYRAPRAGRNPATGDSVAVSGKYAVRFKAGKEMRARVESSTTEIQCPS